MRLFWPSGLKVHIDQGVEFVHKDLDIVRAHTRTHHRQPFSTVPARMGDKFTPGDLYFDLVKIAGHCRYPFGITYGNNRRSQMLWLQIQMVDAPIWIDD